MPKITWIWLAVIMLLLIWGSRIIAIDSFPVFIDETIHIHTQERITTTSPLVDSQLGRLGTIWWLFLFQPHHSDPIWIARVAISLSILPGVAALMALARKYAGWQAMLLYALFALFSTYHFFFERLALADPIAASLVLQSIYFASRLRWRIRYWDAVYCGLALFLAVLAKTNVLPYLGIPFAAVLVLPSIKNHLKESLIWFITALSFSLLPIFLLDYIITLVSKRWLLATLTYIQSRSSPEPLISRVIDNLWDMIEVIATYLHPIVFILLLIAVFISIIQRRWYLLLVFIAPLFPILIGEPQETRYWVVPVALFGLIGSITLVKLLDKRPRWLQGIALGMVLLWGGLNWLPQILMTAHAPINLTLPEQDHKQYILSDAIGFGFEQLPEYIPLHTDVPIIGAVASCQGLRYTFWDSYDIRCRTFNPNGQDAPMLFTWIDEFRTQNPYVILEDSPFFPESLDAEVLGLISRAGNQASLTIYRVRQ